MTKKHFKALADILADAKRCAITCNGEQMRELIALQLIELCRNENERFDERRFRKAAQLEERP